jgi:hypothetical protein
MTESSMTVAAGHGCWTWQHGQFETWSCGCHRDGDNAGDQGEIGKRREAVKLESAIPESAFDVVVGPVANNVTLHDREQPCLEMHMSSTCVESGVLSTAVRCLLW